MINLNIAGAVVHYDAFSKQLPILKLTNKNIALNVYEGPNLCQWNGGRINRDIVLTDEMIQKYNKHGITISLTFTNPTIDLSDSIGNDLLLRLNKSQQMYNIRNKIVLVNEELRQYIRKNYPDFELIYSITGHPSNTKITDELLQRYVDLEFKYDWVVPKFENVFEPKFYNTIDPSKYELLINDTCIYSCPHYHEHFSKIAEQNTISKNPWKELGHDHCFKVEECWLDWFNPDEGCKKHKDKFGERMGMDFTREMIKKAINIGYKSFKISGRENSTDYIMYEVRKFYNDINERSK
ncbi:MAG: hypothetical protein ACO3AG_00765 [Fluviibacter sp.]